MVVRARPVFKITSSRRMVLRGIVFDISRSSLKVNEIVVGMAETTLALAGVELSNSACAQEGGAPESGKRDALVMRRINLELRISRLSSGSC